MKFLTKTALIFSFFLTFLGAKEIEREYWDSNLNNHSFREIGCWFKEAGKELVGNTGPQIADKIITEHRKYCKQMGLVYKNSDVEGYRGEDAKDLVEHIWIWYYINDDDVDLDLVKRVYIQAYEKLYQMVNNNPSLRPYMVEYPFTRENERISVGFVFVNKDFVLKQNPCHSYIGLEKGKITVETRKYEKTKYRQMAVVEEEIQEEEDYFEAKKRLGV